MTEERHTFTDAQWQRIEPSMPPCKGRSGEAYRAFFDALLWITRTGASWRDLPERLSSWNLVHQRYAYWCKKGCFERLFQGMQQPDMAEVRVDSTCCRAHQSSAGARKTNGLQAIGITRGRRNTKIHAVCDALGNPLRFVLTAQASVMTPNPCLNCWAGCRPRRFWLTKHTTRTNLSRLQKVNA